MSRDLTLAVKREYFEAIYEGEKVEEYRLVTPYWRKRLEGRTYECVIITLGYPSRDDALRRTAFKWEGAPIKTIKHPHFGPKPVKVFAISLRTRPPCR